MAGVTLKGISKVYDKNVKAVKSVDIEIKDKEFVVLVGPSGCGKSTILRMIAGLEEISEGELYIGDKKVNDVVPKDRDIAMVFQNYALYPHMSVYENMAFGLKLRKTPKDEIERLVKNAADILGLTEYLNRKPAALSGGQRQRVAVGRSIVRNPKVFLFDEPLSNLDAKRRTQMRTEISKLHIRLETTMIYVTHDQVEAMTMGDRIVVLNDGLVQQIDTPLNLYSNPINKFVAGFIGSPAMNFIDGHIIMKDGISFQSENFSITLKSAMADKMKKYNNQKVIMGIRPEDIKAGNKNDHLLTCQVEVVEPMGNETILYLKTSEGQLISRTSEDLNVQAGSTFLPNFDIANAHFFNSEGQKI